MKKKDLSGVRSKTIKELVKLVEKKSLEYAKVKAAIKAGQEKNLKKVKLIRHEISQILTVIKEKEIVDKLEKKKEIKDSKVKITERKK
jgi:ribosomal protein L29